MNKMRIIGIALIICITVKGIAQTDSLLIFNLESGGVELFEIPPYDDLITSANTDWHFDLSDSLEPLPVDIPEEDENGWFFSPLTKAQDLFLSYNYPLSATVKLRTIVDGDTLDLCSGMMVESQYVLTAAHCVGYRQNELWTFYDSVLISPAYDNDAENPLLGSTHSVEYIMLKSNYDAPLSDDIAFIKCAVPIGYETGWVGIGYDSDPTFFESNLFHTFSYPGCRGDECNTVPYDADTLYYNSGLAIGLLNGFATFSRIGYMGMSGSSLLYASNDQYISYGPMVWAFFGHRRFTQESFTAFQSVLNSTLQVVTHKNQTPTSIRVSGIYPNPFNSSGRLNYSLSNSGHVKIIILDVLGRELTTVLDEPQIQGTHSVPIFTGNLASGIYFCAITSQYVNYTVKFSIIK
ncbi:MAG: T9SS type A sorting domain-containing protein [Candidatus Marinimicrobia bacterium]|nr:T9SS type A sorting domain-containing protein [Candidatus Neomarinimicrobiota bacterium]